MALRMLRTRQGGQSPSSEGSRGDVSGRPGLARGARAGDCTERRGAGTLLPKQALYQATQHLSTG